MADNEQHGSQDTTPASHPEGAGQSQGYTPETSPSESAASPSADAPEPAGLSQDAPPVAPPASQPSHGYQPQPQQFTPVDPNRAQATEEQPQQPSYGQQQVPPPFPQPGQGYQPQPQEFQQQQYPPYQQPMQQGYQQPMQQQVYPEMKDRSTMYLIFSILEILLCGGIFAIIPLVLSIQYKNAFATGNLGQVMKKEKQARHWLIIVLIVGIIGMISFFYLISTGEYPY